MGVVMVRAVSVHAPGFRRLMVRAVLVQAPCGSWGTPGGPGSRPPCESSADAEDPATSLSMADGLRDDAESPGFRPGLA